MPKIIENLRDDILREAMNIINEGGMDALSLRSISSRLGIAPSTIYNYYSGKEELIAELLQRRWETALHDIDRMTEGVTEPCEALELVAAELKSSVKPLLRLHISSAKGMENAHGHAQDCQRLVFSELESRVRAILMRCGRGDMPEQSFRVITKLLVTCTHDPELSISEIVSTARAL